MTGRRKAKRVQRLVTAAVPAPVVPAPAPTNAQPNTGDGAEGDEADVDGETDEDVAPNAAPTQISTIDYVGIHDLPVGPTPLPNTVFNPEQQSWIANLMNGLQFDAEQMPNYDLEHANLAAWRQIQAQVTVTDDETYPTTDADQRDCVLLILRALWGRHGKLEMTQKNMHTHLEKIGSADADDTVTDAQYRADKAATAVHTAWWMLEKCRHSFAWYWRGTSVPLGPRVNRERPTRFMTFAYYFTTVLDVLSRHNQTFSRVIEGMMLPALIANPWEAEKNALTDAIGNMTKRTLASEANAAWRNAHPGQDPKADDLIGWRAINRQPPLPAAGASHEAHTTYHLMRWSLQRHEPPPAGLFITRLVPPLSERVYGANDHGPIPAVLLSERSRLKGPTDNRRPNIEAALVQSGAFGSAQVIVAPPAAEIAATPAPTIAPPPPGYAPPGQPQGQLPPVPQHAILPSQRSPSTTPAVPVVWNHGVAQLNAVEVYILKYLRQMPSTVQAILEQARDYMSSEDSQMLFEAQLLEGIINDPVMQGQDSTTESSTAAGKKRARDDDGDEAGPSGTHSNKRTRIDPPTHGGQLQYPSQTGSIFPPNQYSSPWGGPSGGSSSNTNLGGLYGPGSSQTNLGNLHGGLSSNTNAANLGGQGSSNAGVDNPFSGYSGPNNQFNAFRMDIAFDRDDRTAPSQKARSKKGDSPITVKKTETKISSSYKHHTRRSHEMTKLNPGL